MMSKKLVVAALGLAGALCAGSAMARGHDDIQWSVTIGSPAGTPGYGSPVYGTPVYSAPAPVYGQPVYTAPAYGYRQYQRPTRWDVDGDGIPNRYDRVYNPRWDRDGNGIPDRQQRYDGRYDGRNGGRYDGWRR